MAARVLALLAAVGMVVGAVAVRARMDDDTERRTTTLRLVCSTELAGVCSALAADRATDVETTVEAAADTAARLTALGPGEDADLDGWLVAGPWPAIVAEARQRAARDGLVSAGPVLARSPVVLAVWPERAAVLAPHCGGEAGWKCLGEAAGEQWASLPGGDAAWGRVTPGHPPVSTAVGLAVVGAATTAYFGRPVQSSRDFTDDDDDDGEYRSWLTRLERSMPNSTPPTIETMLLRGPSAFDAVGTIEAEAGPLLASTARDPKPELLYPEPVATADVVLGTTGGREAELLTGLVSGPTGRRALAAEGWRVPDQPLAPGLRPDLDLPPDSGLPPAGVLDALRELVGQVTR